jgi:hypothetical protein
MQVGRSAVALRSGVELATALPRGATGGDCGAVRAGQKAEYWIDHRRRRSSDPHLAERERACARERMQAARARQRQTGLHLRPAPRRQPVRRPGLAPPRPQRGGRRRGTGAAPLARVATPSEEVTRPGGSATVRSDSTARGAVASVRPLGLECLPAASAGAGPSPTAASSTRPSGEAIDRARSRPPRCPRPSSPAQRRVPRTLPRRSRPTRSRWRRLRRPRPSRRWS